MQKLKQYIETPIREALAHIGITKEEQFSKRSCADIWNEINTFWVYFPKKRTEITEEKIREAQLKVTEMISKRASTSIKEKAQDLRAPSNKPSLLDILNNSNLASTGNTDISAHSQRKASISFHTQALDSAHIGDNSEFTLHKLENISPQTNTNKLKQNSSHAIRAKHPYWTLGMAMMTLIAMPLIALIFFFPFIAYLTQMRSNELILALLLSLSYLGVFIALSQFTCCEICQCKTFTLGSFPHSKFAHRILFFGVSFSTALHIIFRMWYRCPACGSSKKLFKTHSTERKKMRKK